MTVFARVFCFCLVVLNTSVNAQVVDEVKTITIKKSKFFLKAKFDDTFYKVLAVDQNGNTDEEAIKSFNIFFKEGKNAFELKVNGNTLPKKTIEYFTKKRKFATNVCITKIKAETKDGHLEELPDLCDIVLFPDCKNNKHK